MNRGTRDGFSPEIASSRAGRAPRSSPHAGFTGSVLAIFFVAMLLAPALVGSAQAGPSPPPPRTAPRNVGTIAPPRPTGLLPEAGGPTFPTPIHHVFVVVLENQPASNVFANAPFEDHLARTYASASRYYAVCHPSAPNYLAMTSGAPWQCGSDGHSLYSVDNLGHLLQTKNLSWNEFAESMPTPCDTSDSYPYMVKHDPFVYYADLVDNASLCSAHVVNFTAWNSDVVAGTIPAFAFFTPNMQNDGHDTSLGTADSWLSGWLSPYLNTTWFQQSVFFIVYDESSQSDSSGYNGTAGGNVFLTAVSPFAVPALNYDVNGSHYNLLETVEWLLGVGNTGQNDSRPGFGPMTGLFNFSRAIPLTASAHANVTSGPAPLAVGFRGNVSGGLTPYRYTWNFSDGNASSVATPNHTFGRPGVYPVRFEVEDQANATAEWNLTVVVTNASRPLTLVVDPSFERAPLLRPLRWSANVTGGSPPYTVSWSFGDGGPVTQGTPVSHAFARVGSYTLVVGATDTTGAAGVGGATATAYLPLTVHIDLSDPNVSLGTPIRATANTTGGNETALAYAWTFNNSSAGGNRSVVELNATAPGLYRVGVVVVDPWGDRAQANASVTVVPPIGPAPPRWPWIALGGGVAAVLGGVGWWFSRRPPSSRQVPVGRPAPPA